MTELDNENTGGLDVEIPFKFVGHEVKIQLANKLDPVSTITGNDWRLLAEKLGYTADEIQVIDEQRHGDGRNTLKLFNAYLKMPGNSVNKVLKALSEMGRPDAYKILSDNLKYVCQKYRDSEMKEKNIPEENSFPCFPADYHSHMMNRNMYMAPGSPFNGFPGYHFWPYVLSHSPLPSMAPPPFMDYHTGNTRSYSESSHPDNSPLSQRPIKNRKVNHHDDKYDDKSDPAPIYDRQQSGVPSSPISNYMNNPIFPPGLAHRGFDSMDVNYSNHSHRDRHISLSPEHTDNENFQRETPAELACTILRGEGQLLSTSLSMSDPRTKSNKRCDDSSSNSDDSLSPDPEFSSPTNGRTSRGHVMRKRRPGAEPKKTPLDNLRNMSQMTKKYIADEKCKGVASDKRTGRELRKPVKTKQEGQRQACEHSNLNAKLLPQRSKSHSTGDSQVRSMDDESVAGIEREMKKSLSLPGNMKPSEFKKAYSKVLVTFSKDSDKHMQRVQSLCNCIEKNGFPCCADIYSNNQDGRKNGTRERLAFYKEKFEEVDFILVCPSKNYYRDITDDTRTNGISSNGFHTKFIYDMMYKEYVANGKVNKRFVPVILEGTSHDDLPRWLLNHTVKYTWPSQYQDLLWMLTRPEERISRHANRRN